MVTGTRVQIRLTQITAMCGTIQFVCVKGDLTADGWTWVDSISRARCNTSFGFDQFVSESVYTGRRGNKGICEQLGGSGVGGDRGGNGPNNGYVDVTIFFAPRNVIAFTAPILQHT